MSATTKPSHIIPYGWHTPSGRMVRAIEVARGRACNCVCVSCGAELIARQGSIRTEHFSHFRVTHCGNALESAVHQMAKQLVCDQGRVFLPRRVKERTIHGKRNTWSESLKVVVQTGGLQTLSNCEPERTVFGAGGNGETRRPDVLATLDGRALAIEIRNTHAVGDEKLAWLEDRGYSVLEISVGDLCLLPQEELHDALEQRLFKTSEHSLWLAHAGDETALHILDDREREARQRWATEEQARIAALEAEDAEQRRKAEFRERVRDIDAFKLRLGQCTVRVGLNAERVSLKVHGFASDGVFSVIKAVAQAHCGTFNPRARCWEFRRGGRTSAFFGLLQTELSRIDWLAAQLSGTDARSMALTVDFSSSGHQARQERFTDPDLQELFQERAAIFEYEAGYSRHSAEQLAVAEVEQRASVRQRLTGGTGA